VGKMSDLKAYNREWCKEHRKEILEKRRKRYWTDPMYREVLIKRTRVRSAVNKMNKVRKGINTEERERVIIVNDKCVILYNKNGLARKIGVTRVTVDNWHRWGILPVPPDVDDLGRYWYRDDYIDKVKIALGKYKVNFRKEVLAARMKRVFSGEVL
jgi:hypothetical protein